MTCEIANGKRKLLGEKPQENCGLSFILSHLTDASPQGTVGPLEAVPEGRLLAIRGYTAAVVGCDPESITGASRFEDGNRHDVYRVSYAAPGGSSAALVVRRSLGDDAAEHAQMEREARVLEKVGGLAAPLLLDFSPTSPWFETPTMSTTFVPGGHLSLSDASLAETERLGSVVAVVHAQSIADLADWLPEGGDLEAYAVARTQSTAARMEWVREPLAAQIRARLWRAAESMEQRMERRAFERSGDALVLLHGDVASGNVLWGPDPVLIDWEYARLGDAADDIAYLFDQNGLSGPQRVSFWQGYGARSGDDRRVAGVRERMKWWEPLTLLGSTLWWVERLVRRTEADATGTADPSVPRAASFYFDEVMDRLSRLDAGSPA